MDDARLVKTSRYLSKHLRHQPERLDLTVGPGGWVEVKQLLEACAGHGIRISMEELQDVVERNTKQRFSFDATGTLIRANQGHSIDVDLELEATEPPEMLYHGTAEHLVKTLLAEGLKKMSRHHVHMSADLQTAISVGAPHGKPVVFEVGARTMYNAGYEFYRSANGVWLSDYVPPEYLTLRA